MKRTWWRPVLFACFVIGVSAALCAYFYTQEKKAIYADFNHEIDRSLKVLQSEALRIESTLKHWQSLYSNASNISAQEFQRVASDVLESHNSLLAVLWAPIVTHQNRASFERELKREFAEIPPPQKKLVKDSDYSQYAMQLDLSQINTTVDKSLYLPIVIAQPQALEESLLGLDMLSLQRVDPRLKFQDVLKSGEVTALPVLPSLFTQGIEPVFNILVPVLNLNENPAEDVVLKGLINAIVPVEQIVHLSGFDVLQTLAQVSISDKSVPATKGKGMHLVYTIGERDFTYGVHAVWRDFEMFGRQFSLTAQPTATYIRQHQTFVPWLLLLVGVLLAAMFLLYIYFLRQHESLLDEIVEMRTKRLLDNNQQLNQANMQLEQLSRVDPLTGIANRREFDAISEKEWQRARREKKSLVILMIDVDHFKNYNDTYGHIKGDECLKQVALCLQSVCSRASDLVARYGGEEFAAVLPSSGTDAMRVAERCRAAVSMLKMEHKMSESSDRVTISIGMSSVVPSDSSSLEGLIDSADRALYLAKVQGRNRVIYHTCLSTGSRAPLDQSIVSSSEAESA